MMAQLADNHSANVYTRSPLSRIFPSSSITVSFTTQLKNRTALYSEEQVYIDQAVPKRVQEFSTGRYCARRAMKQAGIKGQAIGMREDGCPKWPEGIVGSISHTQGFVAAAIGRSNEVDAIGIDIERIDENTSDGVWELICTPEELCILNGSPSYLRSKYAFTLFSTKESIAKCIYFHHGVNKALADIPVQLNLQDGTFSTVVEGSARKIWQGRFVLDGDYVFSGLWLPAGTFLSKI